MLGSRLGAIIRKGKAHSAIVSQFKSCSRASPESALLTRSSLPSSRSSGPSPQEQSKKANAKAMNVLAQAMPDDIFELVADCETAKDIWDSLTTTSVDTWSDSNSESTSYPDEDEDEEERKTREFCMMAINASQHTSDAESGSEEFQEIISDKDQSWLCTSSRKISTSSTTINSIMSETTCSGLKLLITEGSQAQKRVGVWLFGCATWVFSLVILGGITRLTRSGLSMTDWKFTGTLPPFSEEEWLLEFRKYQESPEYRRMNKGMSLQDFKFIYWMEYAHRMWGRALGVVFAVPFTYFLMKGYITRRLGIRLSALFALGAGQGLIGWWMVKSGLEEPASEYVQPRVSPYRLATHLTSAFVIYCGLLWTALSVVMPEPPTESLNWVNGAAKIRKMTLPISVLVGITVVSGAFVAGNDAGHAYNTFPKMGDSWIPDDIFSMTPFFRNFFENTSTVQLNHRILATTTLISIGSFWWAARKVEIHPAVRSLIGSTVGMVVLQVTLGISTLLSYVPVSLASGHQAGALSLMTLLILLMHTLRKPSLPALKALASSPKI